jgi:hypothetical protein
MPGEPFEVRLELVRVRRKLLLAAVVAAVAAVVALFALIAIAAERVPGDVFGAALWSFLGLILVAAGLFLLGIRHLPLQANVRADERGLLADGVLLLAREQIETGYVQPPAPEAPKVSIVHLVGRRWFERIDVAVRDPEIGTRLLAALGLDASRSVAHFRVRQGLFANKTAQGIVSALVMTFCYQGMIFVPGPTKLPVMLAIGLLAILNALPSRMSIGLDGVLVASLVRRKFYSFANVASVEPSAWGVTVVAKDGKRVELRTRVKAVKGAQMFDATTMSIVERIQAGIIRHDATTSAGPDPAALVARGERTYEEWVRSLRALTGEAGYRGAAVPSEALWRVIEDPKAEASARAGAALALRESLDDPGRARLRVAVEASASPAIRVALGAIAREETEEEELRGAVEACERRAR